MKHSTGNTIIVSSVIFLMASYPVFGQSTDSVSSSPSRQDSKLSESKPQSRLSPCEATERATQFVRLLSIAEVANKTEFQPDRGWLSENKWRIQFGKQYEVNISDDSGAVVQYTNHKNIKFIKPQITLSKIKSKEETIKRTCALLERAGWSGFEMVPNTTRLRENYAEGEVRSHSWLVKMSRAVKGVPYTNEYAAAHFIAETGELISFFVGIHTPVAKVSHPFIPQKQAEANALATLTKDGDNFTLRNPQKQMVNPHSFQHDTVEQRENWKSLPAVPSWTFFLKRTATGQAGQIYIHAETGTVIGYEIYHRHIDLRSLKLPVINLPRMSPASPEEPK